MQMALGAMSKFLGARPRLEARSLDRVQAYLGAMNRTLESHAALIGGQDLSMQLGAINRRLEARTRDL